MQALPVLGTLFHLSKDVYLGRKHSAYGGGRVHINKQLLEPHHRREV